ncbi:unnamed protein product [Chrysodeixis includens]|uniref:Protein KRI1 homolog n=1 Tax=Chrysodeixis includens TaxID=689277 RepID=A0A9P0BQX6_CHRIL|nr:unnamed protein product [Chrysodeixis includens]
MTENWEKYEPEHEEADADGDGPHCEDDDFNMDAEYNPKEARGNLLEELQKMGKKRRNRKKKSKLAELLSSEKPKFVPTVEDKTYDQYMEEYYKMDCEDVIGGDLPTRFKYREVVPNDYGLTVEEILLADDKELTQWVPLKKILKHRPDNVEKGDAKTYAHKAADLRLKKKILPSLFKDLPEEPEIVVPIEETKKKKKKKKKNKQKNTEDGATAENGEVQAEEQVVEEQAENGDVENTPKKKKKDKLKDKLAQEDQQIEEETSPEASEEVKQKKKKKKHKSDGFIVEDIVNDEPAQEISENNVILKEGKKKKKNKQNKANENGDTEQINSTKDLNTSLPTDTNDTPSKKKDKNLKRKAETNTAEPSKKKKKGNKEFKKNFKNDKFKNKNQVGPVNPLVNLSDERLKAFGLNPKRYKNFMKFKKF